MKILHIVKLFYPPEIGGVELFVNEISKELAKEHEVAVLCASNDNNTKTEKIDGYTVYRSGSLGRLFSTPIAPTAYFHMKKIVSHYDVIHFHHPNPLFTLLYWIIRPDQRLIVHWHSDIVRQWYFMPFFKPFQDFLLKRADRIVCTTPNYMESSPHLKNFREKCVAVPLGINPDRLVVDEERLKRIKQEYSDKKMIFTLGRLVPYKGFEYLIKAAKDINAYILIGGSGKLKSELEELIEKEGVGDKVRLLGRLENTEIPAYFKACDIFVLPSVTRNEAFGIVQMEAMFFGKPLVSTNIPGSGVSWVNQNNYSGYTVEPRRPDSLSKAINSILDNDDEYKRFSENAKKRFENEFYIEKTAKRLIEIFK